ncbi:MAG: RHS repeat-associated core domain-containing protein [Bacteroidales bacterium]|nr:RHS repeat-associated core domain-containing protein [Bacteroidales bacterium]
MEYNYPNFADKVKTTGSDSLDVHLHVTDHLGSVRAVVDGKSGEILERDDYYPFGMRWASSSPTLQSNLWRYNGKELQTFAGIPYIDYGAKMYDYDTGRWFVPDPLAEKYYSVSPYAFCCGNPVNFVDPNGKVVWVLPALPYLEVVVTAAVAAYTAHKLTQNQASDLSGWKDQQRKDREARDKLNKEQLNVQDAIEKYFPDPDNYDPNDGPNFRNKDNKFRAALFTFLALTQSNSFIIEGLLLLEGDDENNEDNPDSVSAQPEEQLDEEKEEQNDEPQQIIKDTKKYNTKFL